MIKKLLSVEMSTLDVRRQKKKESSETTQWFIGRDKSMYWNSENHREKVEVVLLHFWLKNNQRTTGKEEHKESYWEYSLPHCWRLNAPVIIVVVVPGHLMHCFPL